MGSAMGCGTGSSSLGCWGDTCIGRDREVGSSGYEGMSVSGVTIRVGQDWGVVRGVSSLVKRGCQSGRAWYYGAVNRIEAGEIREGWRTPQRARTRRTLVDGWVQFGRIDTEKGNDVRVI
ncbi:hypothetical protein AG1IA_09139 [Rhizoctonia solani AG-1 IA]|uniref:Uncharacterized protein n=1 Tax=Thanatephorus cucumeris (strain AG1-IA) TaxID=983506 RepID=L8WFW2_THACA|nr:hypothetical protein AG1IA_09139 [Rhizoctonia solani AG-1 IA]